MKALSVVKVCGIVMLSNTLAFSTSHNAVAEEQDLESKKIEWTLQAFCEGARLQGRLPVELENGSIVMAELAGDWEDNETLSLPKAIVDGDDRIPLEQLENSSDDPFESFEESFLVNLKARVSVGACIGDERQTMFAAQGISESEVGEARVWAANEGEERVELWLPRGKAKVGIRGGVEGAMVDELLDISESVDVTSGEFLERDIDLLKHGGLVEFVMPPKTTERRELSLWVLMNTTIHDFQDLGFYVDSGIPPVVLLAPGSWLAHPRLCSDSKLAVSFDVKLGADNEKVELPDLDAEKHDVVLRVPLPDEIKAVAASGKAEEMPYVGVIALPDPLPKPLVGSPSSYRMSYYDYTENVDGGDVLLPGMLRASKVALILTVKSAEQNKDWERGQSYVTGLISVQCNEEGGEQLLEVDWKLEAPITWAWAEYIGVNPIITGEREGFCRTILSGVIPGKNHIAFHDMKSGKLLFEDDLDFKADEQNELPESIAMKLKKLGYTMGE